MAQEQNTSRRTQGQRQAPRRNDMNYCENCGEYYAKTYRRCPFCDERAGRSSGKRTSRNTRGGGYGKSSVTPIQMVYLVVSLILIIAALFIVLTKVGPLLFKDPAPSAPSSSTSQSGGDVSTPQPEDPTPPAVEPDDPVILPQAISLSREDMTLNPGEDYQILAAISPAGVTEPVVWSTSDPTLATVDQEGNVLNVNQTIEKKNVTITATCGDITATCIVRCKPGGTDPGPGTDPTPDNPSGPVPSGTMGTVVNATSGLNIRSGPGSSYKKIASATNGSKVKILDDPQNGWYKVEYGNNLVGYVSSDYVSVTY